MVVGEKSRTTVHTHAQEQAHSTLRLFQVAARPSCSGETRFPSEPQGPWSSHSAAGVGLPLAQWVVRKQHGARWQQLASATRRVGLLSRVERACVLQPSPLPPSEGLLNSHCRESARTLSDPEPRGQGGAMLDTAPVPECRERAAPRVWCVCVCVCGRGGWEKS